MLDICIKVPLTLTLKLMSRVRHNSHPKHLEYDTLWYSYLKSFGFAYIIFKNFYLKLMYRSEERTWYQQEPQL